MPRKPMPKNVDKRNAKKARTTARNASRVADGAASAAAGAARPPQVAYQAAPQSDSDAAQEYIDRIRKAQNGINGDCLYKPLPPSAEIIDNGKSRFRPEYYELVFNYCLLGATNNDIAMFLGIPRETVGQWAQFDELFMSALQAGRDQADARVGQSLYRRALGYSHKAVKFFYDPKNGHVEEVEYTQHYPPETAAAIFWLKNRQPDRWKDKVLNEHTGANGKPIEVEHVRTNLAERLARIADANTAGRSDPVSERGRTESDRADPDGESEE